MSIIRSHPLSAFFVLACAFSWWTVPVLGGPLGVGPFIAAVIVLAVSEGWAGVRALLRRIVQWRVSWQWYAAAILLPTIAALVAAAGTVALGAPVPTAQDLAAWTDILPFFLFALLVPLLGPWEEPGFRGFALQRLMRRQSPLVAGLLVGVMIVFWHLPLFRTGEVPPSDVVQILAAAVVFAALVIASGGSVLVAMVMHAASNAVSGEFISPIFADDAETLGWIRALVWCLFALGAVALAGRDFRTRPQITVVGPASIELTR
jgi:uncharacterized protein